MRKRCILLEKKLHYNYYESPIGLIEIGGTTSGRS